MSLIKYVERINRIDSLIHLRATGTPAQFAGRLDISRSTLFGYLQEMRILGADIKYSHELKSYYYADNRRIRL
jgi:predicted DNA-binding transcriptional regulator YafY